MSAQANEMIDFASDADAAWFREHPDRKTRVRPQLRGELPASAPHKQGLPVVIVSQIHPGVRMRVSVVVLRQPPDTEAAAACLLLEAMDRLA